LELNDGAVVVDTANVWPPLVQVAVRVLPVNDGKPFTEIMVAEPAFDPVKLTVTVEAADATLLLNAMDIPE